MGVVSACCYMMHNLSCTTYTTPTHNTTHAPTNTHYQGGEGGLLEVFARYPLPLHPVLPHDHHTCTARGCHDCTHRATSEAASLALSEAAARAAVEAAKREGGSNAAAEVMHERLVPAWIIQTDAMVNYLSIGM